MLDPITLKKLRLTTGTKNCLMMGFSFLKSEQDVTNFNDKMLSEFSDTISDIWRPLPTASEKIKKDKVIKELKTLLPKIRDDPSKYFIDDTINKTTSNYKNVQPLLKEWEQIITRAKKKIVDEGRLQRANPFLTVSVEKNLKSGNEYQINAKLASSLETSWGGWIENALIFFNSNLIPIHAGRIDFILDNVVYDVKSGPAVLNIRDVDGAKAKRKLIQGLQKKSFGKFIKISDFKIGIIYGREEIAAGWMQNSEGMIIFGTDTWKILTGDPLNVYKFFIWQIQYGIEFLKKSWTIDDLKSALDQFLMSYYGNCDLLDKLLEESECKNLKKLLKK